MRGTRRVLICALEIKDSLYAWVDVNLGPAGVQGRLVSAAARHHSMKNGVQMETCIIKAVAEWGTRRPPAGLATGGGGGGGSPQEKNVSPGVLLSICRFPFVYQTIDAWNDSL